MFKKNIAIILCLGFLLNTLLMPNQAKAWPSVATTSVGALAGIFGDTGIFAQLGTTIGTYVKENWESMTIAASKMAALWLVQKITNAIIGSGNGGTITDWNNYLYVSPQQRAMAQMNSFFNTVSRGRLSSLNYEGVGPNYDAYLVAQARMAIAGQPFTTNLQESTTYPKELFSGGNMKGIMNYMQCANNVACYTLNSQSQYAMELAKATKIAEMEQDRGFLPSKKNGKITRPAALMTAAFSQVDQLGTEVIMKADPEDGLGAAEIQIAKGTAMSVVARTMNYATSDAAGRAAIQNKNDEFPFSLAYSANTGIGFSAGGVTVGTGAGAFNGNLQIGNVCASGNFTIAGDGATVDIHGNKITCPAGSKSKFTGTAPSIQFTLPSSYCTDGSSGDNICQLACNASINCKGNSVKCLNNKCVAK
jgi:hypothetical protein